jgi:hypothetical protein
MLPRVAFRPPFDSVVCGPSADLFSELEACTFCLLRHYSSLLSMPVSPVLYALHVGPAAVLRFGVRVGRLFGFPPGRHRLACASASAVT